MVHIRSLQFQIYHPLDLETFLCQNRCNRSVGDVPQRRVADIRQPFAMTLMVGQDGLPAHRSSTANERKLSKAFSTVIDLEY